MKRNSVLIAAATIALAALPLQNAFAQGHGGGGHGGGGMHGGGGQGGWGGSHGGGNWHGGDWHGGGHWHGGYYWGPSFSFYAGAPWYWGYPYYPYSYGYGGSTIIYDDPAPAYWGPAQGAVIPAPAMNPAPVSPRPATQFRYYCPDSGYYPDVKTCPRGWVQSPVG